MCEEDEEEEAAYKQRMEDAAKRMSAIDGMDDLLAELLDEGEQEEAQEEGEEEVEEEPDEEQEEAEEEVDEEQAKQGDEVVDAESEKPQAVPELSAEAEAAGSPEAAISATSAAGPNQPETAETPAVQGEGAVAAAEVVEDAAPVASEPAEAQGDEGDAADEVTDQAETKKRRRRKKPKEDQTDESQAVVEDGSAEVEPTKGEAGQEVDSATVRVDAGHEEGGGGQAEEHASVAVSTERKQSLAPAAEADGRQRAETKDQAAKEEEEATKAQTEWHSVEVAATAPAQPEAKKPEESEEADPGPGPSAGSEAEEFETFECKAGNDVQELGIFPAAFPPDPVEIYSVTEGSWAAGQGVVAGDILVAINGQAVPDKKDMKRLMRERPLRLTFQRPAFETPEESADETTAFECRAGPDVQDLGIYPAAFPPEAMQVASVAPGSWAAMQGVSPGDELVEIDGQQVQDMTAKEAKRAMRERPLLLVFHRADPGDSSVPTSPPSPAPRKSRKSKAPEVDDALTQARKSLAAILPEGMNPLSGAASILLRKQL